MDQLLAGQRYPMGGACAAKQACRSAPVRGTAADGPWTHATVVKHQCLLLALPAGPLPVRRGRLLGGCWRGSTRRQAPRGGQVSRGRLPVKELQRGQAGRTKPAAHVQLTSTLCSSCRMPCRPLCALAAALSILCLTHLLFVCAGAPAWWGWRRAGGRGPPACPHPPARLCRCAQCFILLCKLGPRVAADGMGRWKGALRGSSPANMPCCNVVAGLVALPACQPCALPALPLP